MGSTTLHFTEKAVVSGSLLDLPTKPVRHGGNSERETRRKSRIKYQAGVLLSAQVSLPNSLDSMGWVCDGSHSLLAICRPTKPIHVCTPSACTASSPMCRCPGFEFKGSPDTFWSRSYKLGMVQLNLADQSPSLMDILFKSYPSAFETEPSQSHPTNLMVSLGYKGARS